MTTQEASPYLVDASGYAGSAERIVVPRSEEELGEVLSDCRSTRTSVTVAGAGTGLTGGRVPHGGWLVSLERFTKLEVNAGFAVCGAGVLLRDLQAAALRTRQFYAPDPTENGASIGGTLATNASGSRSFRYGDTRRHVRAIRVLLVTGEVLALRRGEKPPFEVLDLAAPATTKNTAGYYLRAGADYLDLFIGSEGTLGIITEAELKLLPAPESLVAGVLFFATEDAVLDAVDELRAVPGLRMIEFVDGASLRLLRGRFPEIPVEAGGALLVEREGEDVDWLAGDSLDESFLDQSWFGTSPADRERFRRFRHALPEAVNDLIRQRGLTKMGSDYAVPIARNREMLAIYRRALDEAFPGRYVIFGHIGDAHLHVNILPENDAEWQTAKDLMVQFARDAVALGGTVSAEHGLGKRKRDLLRIQYIDEEIEKMKDVKRRLDPLGLLGRGTLFESI